MKALVLLLVSSFAASAGALSLLRAPQRALAALQAEVADEEQWGEAAKAEPAELAAFAWPLSGGGGDGIVAAAERPPAAPLRSAEPSPAGRDRASIH